MLTSDMIHLIENHRAGMVATIRADGSPAVSPKATFVVLDDRTLAYGNIRSPGTTANIREKPEVEVCFIDAVTRRAVRVGGVARIEPKARADGAVFAAFERDWADYLDVITSFVVVHLTSAELILSPAYDVGHTQADLTRANMAKLNALYKVEERAQ